MYRVSFNNLPVVDFYESFDEFRFNGRVHTVGKVSHSHVISRHLSDFHRLAKDQMTITGRTVLDALKQLLRDCDNYGINITLNDGNHMYLGRVVKDKFLNPFVDKGASLLNTTGTIKIERVRGREYTGSDRAMTSTTSHLKYYAGVDPIRDAAHIHHEQMLRGGMHLTKARSIGMTSVHNEMLMAEMGVQMRPGTAQIFGTGGGMTKSDMHYLWNPFNDTEDEDHQDVVYSDVRVSTPEEEEISITY